MSLSEKDIVVLGLGVGCIGLIGTIMVWNKFMKFDKMTNENVFYIKKWLLLVGILLLNAGGCVLVYYTQNLKIVFGIIVAMKSKDILMAIMFVCNMIYRNIVRYPGEMDEIESDIIDKVVVFVPVYDESIEQVNRTINSITENKCRNKKVLIVVVSDGKTDYANTMDVVTNQTIDIYKSWKGVDIKCFIKMGKKNNKDMIYIEKDINSGKKDSIILLNDLFNVERGNMSGANRLFKTNVMKEVESLFGEKEYNYIMYTDGDTVLDENAIDCLVDTIKKRGAKACCGMVNVDKSNGNVFWNNLQNFQYLYGQYMRRTNEDLLNQVLCLPGCITMMVIDESMADVFKMYSTLPEQKNLFETSVQCVGTDRRLTSCIVYTDGEAKILQDTRAHAYTNPPDNFSKYISQRKRWAQNMFFNSINNIFGRNVVFLSRVFNVVDMLRMSFIYFRFFNTLYFVYLLIKNYEHKEAIKLVPYIILLTYPAICFMIYGLINGHLRVQYINMVIYLIVNKIFTMLTSILIFTLMLANIGNSNWRILKQ
jgi:chitin synthase